MQDELLEGAASLRDDQKADGRSACDECLLDRPASGDQLLVRPKLLGRRQRRRPEGAPWTAAAISAGSPVERRSPLERRSRTLRARTLRARTRRTVTPWSVVPRTGRTVSPRAIVAWPVLPGSVVAWAFLPLPTWRAERPGTGLTGPLRAPLERPSPLGSWRAIAGLTRGRQPAARRPVAPRSVLARPMLPRGSAAIRPGTVGSRATRPRSTRSRPRP
jgi:hypothetical protein